MGWGLDGVKVGDFLLVTYGSIHSAKGLEKVARLTATQAITEEGGRWRLKDGYRPGSDSYGRAHATIATEEDMRDVYAENARRNLQYLTANREAMMNVPCEALKEVLEILRSYTEPKANS